ncbi:RNA degradosome polyphosphate kinase [Mumia zhuanghuii]|uniref:Polyphosphate kinase n=1 Tax=Mumia zhuanghuii TaxID=2585211 RepID=A0A5C4ME83_9ACTN|nr:RNA degradosome polyphosphate kinase [Mumia zhuanghuii]TNC37501.1 RNA degradosome polyphosphate kinase [Mumia zhuanghuii]TNC44172.1 RNA degradosome polyphosphate kinase [Mumia zhuanghuii]
MAEELATGVATATAEGPRSPDSFDVDPPYEAATGDLPEDRFSDRELSWLAFNERVLELAEDPTVPLLERIRFTAIFSGNLDEFFMVRIAGLKRRLAAGLASRRASGIQPREVWLASLETSRELMLRQGALLTDTLRGALDAQGIALLHWGDLDADEQAAVGRAFRARVFPVLTPLAVDPAHPFPYISGLSLNLAVVMRNPATGKSHFARVKVPPIFDRWLEVAPQRFVPLEEVIAAHLDALFPGMEILAHHSFRVTRNEDLEVEEDDAENLLKALEQELLRRKFGPPVRLEVEDTMDEHVRELLVTELDISADEVFALPAPLDLASLHEIADLDRPELHFEPFVPMTHPDLAEVESASPVDMFTALREKDVLLHHPYDSFATSVQRFVEQAASDPQVLAIKQTLYRTSGDSPIIDSLVDAARAGKQVLVLVEIKARFDEQANIRWARKLERAGCHVVYGLLGLKTHCKLCLVVRDEPDGLRRYAHVGTGNYNPKTARLYEDYGLLTTDPRIADDLTDLFNNLSGYSRRESYGQLLVAPAGLRPGIIERIEREVAHHRAGRPAGVRIKVNSIVDEEIIDALYRASQAGVPVQMLVRGICALRPGVPGMSDNIVVRSVLGRFLEHSRVYWFGGGGEPEVWIGSADLMHRNLDRRVEVLVRLDRPEHIAEIGAMLELSMDPGIDAWNLGPDGTWTRQQSSGAPLRDLQQVTIDRTRSRRARARAEAKERPAVGGFP